jgi:AcrR family transcriptional regulator
VPKPSESRKYESPLRQAQAERTAEVIVEAAAQEIAENGMADLSMPRVAERAGVAVRTLYRHFASRDDLLLAIGERLERDMKGSGPPIPTTTEEFIESMPPLFEFFEQNAEAVEALHATVVGRQIRKAARARRTEMTRAASDALYEGMSERDRTLAFAMVRVMFGSATWLALRKEMGLDADEAKDAVRWMAEMYVREIKRRRRQAPGARKA